jgi:AmmeMemoRadiSam system protein A
MNTVEFTTRMYSPDKHNLPGTELLRLARASIEHGLINSEPLPVDCGLLPPALAEPGATFTTLRSEGELRGCCGTLEAVRPLAEDAARSAFQSAFRDSRFAPVREQELGVIRLEVSVLSPLEPMKVTDEQSLMDQLTPGTDGLVIIAEGNQATLLPKAWDMLPDPQQFLDTLKAKCGLPKDFWSGQLEFQRYRATTYAEPN